MMASIDEDVEKSSLADHDDVGSKTFDSVKPLNMLPPHFLRSSGRDDHRCSRRDSPEYDRHEGRVVSRRYSDDRDYRDRSKPLPRHRRDYRH
ncbi:hypothetical protein Tco_1370142 [Tanacetum coccineum]